jgi:hypothetical protein
MWNVQQRDHHIFHSLKKVYPALQIERSRVRFPIVSLDFFIDIILLSHYGSGVDSASNRNEYQEYFLGVKAAGA